MLTESGRTLLERWIYVLVKVGDDFVAPYTAQRRAAVLADPAYGADFPAFLERFLAALCEGAWQAGSYYPGGWYRMLQGRQVDPAGAAITPEAVGPFFLEEVRVDESGRWFVGSRPIGGRVLRHFLSHLEFDGELGRYRIRYRMEQGHEVRYLHHLTPPVRVHRVTVAAGAVRLHLNTGAEEELRPGTLRMRASARGGGEELYCAVGPEHLPAWFEEPARWELLKDAEERDGAWALRVGGRELTTTLDAPWTYVDTLPEPGAGA